MITRAACPAILTPAGRVRCTGSEVLVGPWSHIGLLDNRVGHARSGAFSAFALHTYALDFARRCCAARPMPEQGAGAHGAVPAQHPHVVAGAEPAVAASRACDQESAAAGTSDQPAAGRGAQVAPAPLASGRREAAAEAQQPAGAAAAMAGQQDPGIKSRASKALVQPAEGPKGAAQRPSAQGPLDMVSVHAAGSPLGGAAVRPDMQLAADGMPVHFYVMGHRPRWVAAPRWPPPGVAVAPLRLYLAPPPERPMSRVPSDADTAAHCWPRAALRAPAAAHAPPGARIGGGASAAAPAARPGPQAMAAGEGLGRGGAAAAPPWSPRTAAEACEGGAAGPRAADVTTVADPTAALGGRRTGSTAEVRGATGWSLPLDESMRDAAGRMGPSSPIAGRAHRYRSCIFLAARFCNASGQAPPRPLQRMEAALRLPASGACAGSSPCMRVTLLHRRQVGALSEACAGTEVRWEHRVEAWKHPKVGAPSAWPGHAGVCMDWLGWGTHVFRTVSVN